METNTEDASVKPTMAMKLQTAQMEEKRLWVEMEQFEAEIKPMTSKLEAIRNKWYDAKKRADALQLMAKEMEAE